MKKIILLVITFFIFADLQAQVDVNKPVVITPASGLDPSIVGRSVMDTLTPKLAMNTDQTSKVTILVGKFLTHKSDFMELKKSNAAEYQIKFADEQKSLFTGLKEALNPKQFKQLMTLKPDQFDSENAISHLFY